METPEETVLAFLGEWGKSREACHAAIRRYFTEATVWENVGWNANVGVQGAINGMEGLRAAKGVDKIRIETTHISSVGDMVLTERVDYMVDDKGVDRLAARCMGVFEVKDGKILAWRDYFDTAGVARDL